RLPCVDVTLEDTTGRVVARTQTTTDGTFQFDAPARGAYRYKFSVWHHHPVAGPTEILDPASERARMYQLAFVNDPQQKLKLWPDTVDSPPGPPRERTQARIRYPQELYTKGIEGTVTVQYAVDSLGAVYGPSIRVISATDPRFEPAVITYLQEVRLAPARRAGQLACALMLNQPFNFSLKP
ncbi:MAG: energy transducer TonB, partial [Gemmatimonadaceae bacterium]